MLIVSLVTALSVAAALGGLVLGRRTSPRVLYTRIFEIAPEPSEDARTEPAGRTASRAAGMAALTTLGLALAAILTMAVTLVVVATPRDELLNRLPDAATLTAGGWLLACGLISLRVSAYFARWERSHARTLLCPPLRSGAMRHVYYAASGLRSSSR